MGFEFITEKYPGMRVDLPIPNNEIDDPAATLSPSDKRAILESIDLFINGLGVRPDVVNAQASYPISIRAIQIQTIQQIGLRQFSPLHKSISISLVYQSITYQIKVMLEGPGTARIVSYRRFTERGRSMAHLATLSQWVYVEDSGVNRLIFLRQLWRLGLSVQINFHCSPSRTNFQDDGVEPQVVLHVFEDSSRAFEYLRAETINVNMLVTDIDMPQMNGDALVRELMQTQLAANIEHCQFIATTARLQFFPEFDWVIYKPLESLELKEVFTSDSPNSMICSPG